MKIKYALFYTILCLSCSFSAFSQMLFSEHFYGEPSHSDFFTDVQATADGGYIAVGQTQEVGKSGQIFLVKFDADGEQIFTENFGTDNLDVAHAIVVLNDRYIIGGSTFSEDTKTNNCYLLAVDLEGQLLTELAFGGDGEDLIYSMTVLNNGRVAVASTMENASTGADINVRLYSENLNLIEEANHDSPFLEVPNYIFESETNGDILVSGHQQNDTKKGLILSYDNSLSTLNWEFIAEATDTSPQQFSAGIDYDENEFAFVAETPAFTDSRLILINKETGIVSEELVIDDFDFSAAPDIAKVNDVIYLFGQNNRSYIIPFNVATNNFGADFQVPVPNFANAMIVKDEKIGLVGITKSQGAELAMISEYNLDFSEDWTTTLGDMTAEKTSSGLAFAEAADNGFFLAGQVPGTIGANIQIHKVDAMGTVIWETTFGSNFIDETPWAITAAADGGCVVVYNIDHIDRRVQKIGNQGDLEWDFYLEEGNIPFFNYGNIVTGANGNFYYAGLFSYFSIEKAFVMCFTQTGEIVWQNNYQINNIDTKPLNITAAENGDLLISCSIDTSEEEPGMIRINADGEVIWDHIYNIADPDIYLTGVTEAANGDIFAVGYSGSTFGISPDIHQGLLLHLSDDGSIINSQILEEEEYDRSMYDIAFGENSGLHTVSYIRENLPENVLAPPHRTVTTRIETFDEDLEILESYELGLGLNPLVYRMLSLSDGGLAAFGSATLDNNLHQYLILIDADSINSTLEIKKQGSLTLLPTASDGNFSINFQSPHTGDLDIKIYHANGQIVHQFKDKKVGEIWQKEVNLPDLAAGNYYVNIRLKDYAWTRQMVKN